MDVKPEYIKWLVDTGDRISTSDGQAVEVWEFSHQADDAVISAWAKHFRNHYCLDDQIDELRDGTSYSRSEYLINVKFPDEKVAPGPSIRSGDFGEILVADYLQFVLGFWVPRTRYSNKAVRNESVKGVDIIGFRIMKEGETSSKDALAIFEAKAQLSGKKADTRLQDAIDGSEKDQSRKAESLNAIKQRFLDKQNKADANRIKRFQNLEDNPYEELYGAAALFSDNLFDPTIINTTTTEKHKKRDVLKLVVIRGSELMKLVHKLYERAADEA